jgi:hypothetical protein
MNTGFHAYHIDRQQHTDRSPLASQTCELNNVSMQSVGLGGCGLTACVLSSGLGWASLFDWGGL